MNNEEYKYFELFLSLNRGSNNWETSIWETSKWVSSKTIVSQTSREGSCLDSREISSSKSSRGRKGIWVSSMGIWVSNMGMWVSSTNSIEGRYTIRKSSSRNHSSSKSGRLWDYMNRGRSLFGSKTTSNSVIKSSLEHSLFLSYFSSIIKISRSNLSCLDISIDRGKCRVFSSFSSNKCSTKCCFGSLDLRSVLNGEGS